MCSGTGTCLYQEPQEKGHAVPKTAANSNAHPQKQVTMNQLATALSGSDLVTCHCEWQKD